MIWVKNYNWERWVYPESNMYKPSKNILWLRERAKKLKQSINTKQLRTLKGT